jgi:hypothetical protein
LNEEKMKTLLVTLFSLFCGLHAHAAQTRDLTDLMTPEDLAQEMFAEHGIEAFGEGLVWKASLENPRLIIVINKAQKDTAADAQTLEAWLDGELLYRTIVSTGKQEPVFIPPNKKYPQGHHYIPSTPLGVFRISSRDINHVSQTWEGASMPFAQFFYYGIAIHATTPEHFHDLGRRASGGCVRLYPRDAKIMWKLVGDTGVEETEIIVYDGTLTPHPLGRVHEAPRYVLPSPLVVEAQLAAAARKKKAAAANAQNGAPVTKKPAQPTQPAPAPAPAQQAPIVVTDHLV